MNTKSCSRRGRGPGRGCGHARQMVRDRGVSAERPRLPHFEVDKAWPKVPPQWKLGDVSSIASDAQGNIYLLHRPRTLKDPDFGQGRAAGDGVRSGRQFHPRLGRRRRRL